VSQAATVAARPFRAGGRRTAPWALALAAACSITFGVLWAGLEGAEVRHADVRATAWLGDQAAGSITALANASSFVGSAQTLAAAALTAAAWLVVRRRALDAALVVVALAGAEVINAVLKNAFERPRPSLSEPLATASGFSFPSGHAMASTALYATLALVLTRGRSMRTRLTAMGTVAALVGAIGLSRVYLGVHFPTDVAAGWSAGLAWAAAGVALLSLVPGGSPGDRNP
jgi:membrane-associated phospholipid phosphatase